MTSDLRPYQIDVIDRARAALRSGGKGIVLVMPTGSGKTRVGAEIARSAHERGRRVIWLANRMELLDQARASVGAWAECHALDTLASRDERPEADLVLYDEVHHACAPTYAEVMAHYLGRVPCIGLTATPQRADGRGLGASGWDRMVVGPSIDALTRDGHLVPCEVLAPAEPLRPGTVAMHPVDAYRTHASSETAIVYAPNLRTADEWRESFVSSGIRAEIIHGGTPALARRAWLAMARDGSLPVVINVAVLTEGTDIPRASCAVIGRGCGTVGLWMQICGRVMRPFEGKYRALVIDLRGASHAHGRPDEERAWTLDGRGVRGSDAGPDARYCQVCGALRVVDTDACDECGFAEAFRPVRVIASPLVKYASFNRMDDDRKAATLARWMRLGQSKGYRGGFAIGRYVAVTGARPSQAVIEAAYRVLRNAGETDT